MVSVTLGSDRCGWIAWRMRLRTLATIGFARLLCKTLLGFDWDLGDWAFQNQEVVVVDVNITNIVKHYVTPAMSTTEDIDP